VRMRIVCTEQSHPPLVVTTFTEYDGGLCAMPEWAEGGSVCAISESERGERLRNIRRKQLCTPRCGQLG